MGLLGQFVATAAFLQLVEGFTHLHIWPLNNETCAYDVKTGNDAVFPRLAECTLEGDVAPYFSQLALRLDGSLSPYLDLDVTVPVPEHYSFFFSLLVKPQVLGGMLLDYYGNRSDCNDCLGYLKGLSVLVLPSGGLSLTVVSSMNPLTATTLTSTITLTNGQWQTLCFSVDENLHLEYVHVSLHESSETQAVGKFPAKVEHVNMAVPGRLRLGASRDGSDPFLGDVTCATLMAAKELPYPPNSSVVLSGCRKPWPQSPPERPQFQSHHMHVFPLFNAAAGYDVISQTSRRVVTSFADLRFDVTTTPLGYGSLLMDGSPLSMVDVTLDFDVIQGNFTLGFYVKLDSSTFGVLAHGLSSSTSGITEFFITKLGNTVGAQLSEDKGNLCGSVTLTLPSSGITWAALAFGRYRNQLFLAVESSAQIATHSCFGSASSSGVVGLLRLGGSQTDEIEGFHGNLACVAVFKNGFGGGSQATTTTVAQCSANFGHCKANVTTDDIIAEGNFRLVKTNEEPSATHPTLAHFTSRSLSACANRCRQMAVCRSYSVSKVRDGDRSRSCRLFDFLIVQIGLTYSPGTAYYALVSK